MADKKTHTHHDFAEKVVAKLPAKVRDATELKAGGGEYTIIRVNGRSVASVRDRSVRITHPHDGSAGDAAVLAKLVAAAAPEPKEEPEGAKGDE